MINKYTSLLFISFFYLFSFSFCQSIQELQKLKSEYETIKNNQTRFQTSQTEVNNQSFTTPNQAFIYPYALEPEIDDSDLNRLIHFGYDFFTKRDTVSFWESLPALPNYLLGPGDELVVTLWGETQIRETFIISRDGTIYDKKVGLLNMSGKNMESALKYLTGQYGRIYETLNGNNPSTFIDISLGKLRSINVNFVGHVKYPGVYPIHPFSTVITGLIQAGGVDTTGSLRNVYVKRNNMNITSFDLYDYLLKGENGNNIQLRNNDVIVVPSRESFVTIDSAVVRPGIFESLEGESIYSMIEIAGGLKYNSSDKIAIKRVLPINERNEYAAYESIYTNFESTNLIQVKSGDKITVYHLLQEVQKVELLGQVKSPGVYNYYNGMTFKNLLELGGGFGDSTFIKSVYQNQAEIIRRNPKSRYEDVIKIDLSHLIKDNKKDLPLQNLDKIIVHANLNYFEKEPVSISGEVNVPGAYPIIMDNEPLSSIILRAGGLTSKALKNGTSIYRHKKYFDENSISRVLSNQVQNNSEILSENKIKEAESSRVRVSWLNDNIALLPGDSIVVKIATGTVNISGMVYNPGLVEYKKGKSLRSYLNEAGGITDRGNKKNIIIIYPNGAVKPNRWYSSPKIENGASIFVNEKNIGEPFNITQFATNWTSIISSMVTVVVLSKQL